MENQSNILIYQTEDGVTKIETRLLEETVWLTQAQLCELFQKSKATISEHIKNVFGEGELDSNSVVRNFRTTNFKWKKIEIDSRVFILKF
jgi:hypothetical protein